MKISQMSKKKRKKKKELLAKNEIIQRNIKMKNIIIMFKHVI
jgi:hypothetical protein